MATPPPKRRRAVNDRLVPLALNLATGTVVHPFSLEAAADNLSCAACRTSVKLFCGANGTRLFEHTGAGNCSGPTPHRLKTLIKNWLIQNLALLVMCPVGHSCNSGTDQIPLESCAVFDHTDYPLDIALPIDLIVTTTSYRQPLFVLAISPVDEEVARQAAAARLLLLFLPPDVFLANKPPFIRTKVSCSHVCQNCRIVVPYNRIIKLLEDCVKWWKNIKIWRRNAIKKCAERWLLHLWLCHLDRAASQPRAPPHGLITTRYASSVTTCKKCTRTVHRRRALSWAIDIRAADQRNDTQSFKLCTLGESTHYDVLCTTDTCGVCTRTNSGRRVPCVLCGGTVGPSESHTICGHVGTALRADANLLIPVTAETAVFCNACARMCPRCGTRPLLRSTNPSAVCRWCQSGTISCLCEFAS